MRRTGAGTTQTTATAAAPAKRRRPGGGGTRRGTALSHLDGVMTHAVGVSFRNGQAALQRLRETPPDDRPLIVELVPEPENSYDPDAIQVRCEVPGMGDVQLGYVQNGETRCNFCQKLHTSRPKHGCAQCGREDLLVRQGFATALSQEMRRDPHLFFYGEIHEVTGGTGYKEHFGLNFRVRAQVERMDPAPCLPTD